MTNDHNQKKEKSSPEELEKKETSIPQVPVITPSGSIGTFNVGTASPMAASAYAAFQSIYFQKEPNPEVEKLRLQGIMNLGDQLHTQTMKQLTIEEKRLEHLADIQKKNDARENRIAFGSFLIITGVIVIGSILIFQQRTAEGVGILAGGLGTVLGYLAGYGQGIKKRTF
jgi:hypothetical protein